MVSLAEATISGSLTDYSVTVIFGIPGRRFPPFHVLYLSVGPPAHDR